GGYLRTAVQIADELLAGKKLVVYTEGAHFAKQDYSANRPGEFEEGRVVVLVDESSASASEILSGALQDWDRALIIGRRTFGKGLVQEQYAMPDNSALRLTIARYYIPSGRSIQKPYEDKEHYDLEVYERFENGEFFKDSIHSDTMVYFTKIKKRKVYGGGGINPDIFVPFDTLTNNVYSNRLRRRIPEFVYNYYSDHSADFEQYNSVKSFDS
ncbi:MAG: S41 family peptidase, partial [Chitinophagales bacterium]